MKVPHDSQSFHLETKFTPNVSFIRTVLNFINGYCLVKLEASDARTTEFGKIGTYLKCLAKIAGNAPDVGSFWAHDPEVYHQLLWLSEEEGADLFYR